MAQRLPRQRQPLRWLHAASSLLLLGQVQGMARTRHQGVVARRAKQRQKLGQRLLEAEIKGWLTPPRSGAVFWSGMRWGGVGFILAWWLKT